MRSWPRPVRWALALVLIAGACAITWQNVANAHTIPVMVVLSWWLLRQ